MHDDRDREAGRIRRRAGVVLGVLLLTTAVAGDDPRAREILDRAKALDRSERHWSDRRQTLTFRIHGGGGETTRELRLYETHAADDTHKILVRFLGPDDVRDVGILALTAKHGGGRQWMYSPETKRLRLLSDSARDQGIAGSDLTHNDLDLLTGLPAWDESDAESALRGEEVVDGEPCYVIDLTPKRADVAYKRIVLWLAKRDLLARRLELFRIGSTPAKRITQGDIRLVGHIPVAHRVTAETVTDRTRTDIRVADQTAFDLGVLDACFELSTLEDPGNDATACIPSRHANSSDVGRAG
jgi:hypothetical protein